MRASSWLLDSPNIASTDRFKGFTRVSHCDKNGNSWCCAGAAGQVLDGADCCLSNETTSLQPYPLSTLDPPANSKTVIVTKTVLISLYLTGAPKFTSSSVDPNRLPAFLTSQTISWKSIIVHSSSVSSHCSTIVPSISVSSQGSTTVRSSSVSSYCSTIVRCSVSSQNSTTVPSSLISSLCPIIVASSSVSSRPLGQNHISSLGIEIGVPLAVMIVVLLVSFAFYIFRKQKLRRREVAELEGRAAWELDAPHNESCYAPRYELG